MQWRRQGIFSGMAQVGHKTKLIGHVFKVKFVEPQARTQGVAREAISPPPSSRFWPFFYVFPYILESCPFQKSFLRDDNNP